MVSNIHCEYFFPQSSIKGCCTTEHIFHHGQTTQTHRRQTVFLTGKMVIQGAFGIATGTHQFIHGKIGKAIPIQKFVGNIQKLLFTLGNFFGFAFTQAQRAIGFAATARLRRK